jgi:hypothetical protein
MGSALSTLPERVDSGTIKDCIDLDILRAAISKYGPASRSRARPRGGKRRPQRPQRAARDPRRGGCLQGCLQRAAKRILFANLWRHARPRRRYDGEKELSQDEVAELYNASAPPPRRLDAARGKGCACFAGDQKWRSAGAPVPRRL